MVYAYCVEKTTDNGNTYEYKLIDFAGNSQIFRSNTLKAMIADGSICVVNLTLTSDKKLRFHAIPTLNDVFNHEKNNTTTALNLNNVYNQNRPLLRGVDPKDCYLYRHKLFFKKDYFCVLDVNNQDIQVLKTRIGRKYRVDNVAYIPNGNCLSIIAETCLYSLDYDPYYSLTEIVYDIYTNNYETYPIALESNKFDNKGARTNFINNHYSLGGANVVTFKDKKNNLLPSFLINIKSNSYIIKAPTLQVLVEFCQKLNNGESKGLDFKITPQLNKLEVDFDNFKLYLLDTDRVGKLTKMR